MMQDVFATLDRRDDDTYHQDRWDIRLSPVTSTPQETLSVWVLECGQEG